MILPYLRSAVFLSAYPGFAQPVCCASSRNGRNPENQETRPQSNRLDAVNDAALTYYRQKYNDSSVTASSKDYGYHIEVIISKNGQPIKDFTYLNGGIYEQP